LYGQMSTGWLLFTVATCYSQGVTLLVFHLLSILTNKVVHSCTDRCRLAGFCLPSPRVILKVLPSWFPIFSAYSPSPFLEIEDSSSFNVPPCRHRPSCVKLSCTLGATLRSGPCPRFDPLVRLPSFVYTRALSCRACDH
jgi:hypothetical protein